MAEPPFVHLHCHTDYSLLDGACEIGQLMQAAAEQGMPAIAITDHGNLFGAVQFYNAARAHGLHPVIGCEVYVAAQGCRSRSEKYYHLVLLSETQEGYRNLIQLVTTAYLEGFYYKPRVDRDLLARHARGLIALSGCLKGDVSEALAAERHEEARRLAYTWQDIFGKGNFFLELQDHGLPQDRVVVPGLVRLSAETGIPLVVTNDTHYLRREDARAHEILLCIQTGKTMSDPVRLRWPTPDFYLKSRAEMAQLFGGLEEALDRTWEIAQRCQVRLDRIPDPFPKFDVPAGHNTDTYFEWAVRQGFEKRRPRLEALRAAGSLKHDLAQYEERLEQEIRTIRQMKFSSYFLIVWDLIRFARGRGIPVGPGRGSAAGSLVSYALGITDMDPLQYGLLFERFLNPERISLPDIDIDFCALRRGEVIQYVTEKYGRDHVAQIITFGTLGARAGIKDVGRALDMSYAEVDRISKLVPNVLNITLDEALRREPALAEAAQKDPRVADVIEVARRLEGMARNASVHAAGVVISPAPLKELVPLYRTGKDEIVTQFDLHGLEQLGLLKMDFLGLTTLSLIHDALRLIETHRGEKLALEDIPLNDARTFEIFSRGLTSGVFQFESAGMRVLLRRAQPSRLEDLIALNALYRPGPIQGGMIDDFVERKHGRRPVVYEIPALKEILEETYGVIVYQEQVMQIAHKLAGYSLGEADILRRAMGKKKPEEMAAQRERFVRGATALGHPRRKVERLFDLMAQFAGYGFNKSHSAAYAYLAYVTAYLKAHYPVYFMAALLTSEAGNSAKLVRYINECREMGIRVLPPDVNASQWSFTPDADAIRFGLGAIKNLGQSSAEAILAARREAGRFRSLYHFCERVDLSALNRRVLENLIKAGAMDSLGGHRAQLLAALDGAIEAGQRAWRDRVKGQAGLFAGWHEQEAPDPPLPSVPEWDPIEQLTFERDVLGLYVTGHPLEQYAATIRELASHTSETLEGLERGAQVALCGLLGGVQRRRSRDGRPWASAVLEDLSGNVELVVFGQQYERLAAELREGEGVLVRGTVLSEEGAAPKVSVREIVPLAVAGAALPALIAIRVPLGAAGDDAATGLARLFERKPGSTEVRLRLERARDFSLILDIRQKVSPDREFREEVERICGPDSLEVLAG